MHVHFSSEWLPGAQLLITRLAGPATQTDVSAWTATLTAALDRIPDESNFRILVDIDGFQAADIEAHRSFRNVIPATLANYGWRVGYLGLFPEVELPVKLTRGVRCVAAAHVHHDASKIGLYERRFRTGIERFFVDRSQAEEWLRSLAL